ncbi:hypothetical protein EBZ37_06060 [bacterium]|nr:hypothetical protein [bacterium]
MSATSIRKKAVNPTNNEKLDVLYQRIGNRWYAFSTRNNDVFVGSIPDEVLAHLDDCEENIVSAEAIDAVVNGAKGAQSKSAKIGS